MKLYLISQTENTDYDTYDAAVVVAESEEEARQLDPGGKNGELFVWRTAHFNNGWCSSPDQVQVDYLGTTVVTRKGVICASFNAG